MEETYKQLVLKLNGKSIIPPSDYEKRRRKIKHIQRYQKKIINATASEIPTLLKDLYSYLFDKEIIDQDNLDYLKKEINIQINTIANAYRCNYPLSDILRLKVLMFSLYFQRYKQNIQLIAATSNSQSITIEAILNTISEASIYNNPISVYDARNYKSKKSVKRLKEYLKSINLEFLDIENM